MNDLFSKKKNTISVSTVRFITNQWLIKVVTLSKLYIYIYIYISYYANKLSKTTG